MSSLQEGDMLWACVNEGQTIQGNHVKDGVVGRARGLDGADRSYGQQAN